jgi:hypothetical protein
MLRWCACFSIVIHQLSRIVARTCVMCFSVVDVDGPSYHFSSVTLVPPFFDMVIHSYKLHCSRALLTCCADSLRWGSAPGTISDHKNRIIAHFSSLVNTENRAAIFTLLRRHCNWPIKIEIAAQSCKESMLLPVCKIKNAATRTRIKINHFRYFLSDSPT